MTNKNLTKFRSLMMQNYTDLIAVIEAQHSMEDPITILAFSDAAFEKIPNSPIGDAFQTDDKDVVRSVLLYHMIPGHYDTAAFGTSFQFLATWLNDDSIANVSSGQHVGVVQQTPFYIFVSGLGTRSTVTTADIEFASGVMHVIDMPLIPPISYPATAETYNTTAFLGASYQNLTLAHFMNLTSDITILAPNNYAFQAVASSPVFLDKTVLSELVDYHIILSPQGPLYSPSLTNGSIITTLQGAKLTVTFASNSLFINSARILQQDLLLANGVMHVLDNVLNYNDSGAQPNPVLPTQVPVLPQGSTTALGIVPFTSAAPDLSSTSSAAATTSNGAAATSDGAAATSDLSAASMTDSSEGPSSTKKSDGSRMGFDISIYLALSVGPFAAVFFLL